MPLARRTEPELMLGAEQVCAYATADFSKPHSDLVRRLQQIFPSLPPKAEVADLGCGPADITIRIARLYPGSRLDAIDGSRAMLDRARETINGARFSSRIRLLHATLPDPTLPPSHYDAVVSNSLLHHLHAPQTLWETIKTIAKPDARVFIADLRRPGSEHEAAQMVERYASDEPEVLRRDFYNSLLAAFTPQELHEQLVAAGLALKIETVGDRHLIIHGRGLASTASLL